MVYKVCLRTAGRKVSVGLVMCLWTKRVVYRSGIASGESAGCHTCHRKSQGECTGCHKCVSWDKGTKEYIGHSGCRHILSVE